jgi:plastocyanin
MTVKRRLLPLLLLAPLAVAGCGSGDGDASAATADCAQPCVVMQDNEFVPRDVTVRPGQAITWVNADSVVHNVVNAREGQAPESPLFGEGRRYTYAPRAAGRIEYVCTVHPGMEGSITVR